MVINSLKVNLKHHLLTSFPEELLKRFPYWDALNEVFNSSRSSAWPMSISSIMHAEEDELFYIKQEEYGFEEESSLSPIAKRRRRSSDQPTIDNTSDSASTTHSTQSLPCTQSIQQTPVIIRPLPRVLPSPTSIHSITDNTRRDNILAESLLQVTREKEAGRMKRSQDMLKFIREKRMERDQLLIEKELTKRVKAKAELVKNLMEAGFDKTAITEQLNML